MKKFTSTRLINMVLCLFFGVLLYACSDDSKDSNQQSAKQVTSTSAQDGSAATNVDNKDNTEQQADTDNTETAPTESLSDNTDPVEQSQDTVEIFKKAEAWLLPADDCPADIMPDKPKEIGYLPDYCFQREAECLEQCQEGDSEACYNLATDLQAAEDDSTEVYSQALFLWACKTGALSGCTNKAAEIMIAQGSDDDLQCAVNTFTKTCNHGDPWGCTMYGDLLINGSDLVKNTTKAVEVLSKSCKYGSEDPACQRAKDLLKQINIKPTDMGLDDTIDEKVSVEEVLQGISSSQ